MTSFDPTTLAVSWSYQNLNLFLVRNKDILQRGGENKIKEGKGDKEQGYHVLESWFQRLIIVSFVITKYAANSLQPWTLVKILNHFLKATVCLIENFVHLFTWLIIYLKLSSKQYHSQS